MSRVSSMVALFTSLVAFAGCGGGPSRPDGTSAEGTGGGTAVAGGSGGGAGEGGSRSVACIDGREGGVGEVGTLACAGAGARFVTDVVSACFGEGQNTGQDLLPGAVAGPPRGGGCCAGTTDVISLGNGGSITVAFKGNAIVDGPGPDFIVFENPFDVSGDPMKPFAELATVEVSDDGVIWASFLCDATAYPYGACAGWRPVYANVDENTVDPLDPKAAGGDPFDLADVGVKSARFVRIVDRPDTPGVFDLDAVAVVNAACP
jgi:hypothetical protein